MQILPRFLGDWEGGVELPKGEGNPCTYFSPPLPLTSPYPEVFSPMPAAVTAIK